MSALVTWDGKDFAAVQMLLAGCRSAGEPACRLTGDQMEVRAGTVWDSGWRVVSPGDVIYVDPDGVIVVGSADAP